jgi:hypothetical protein
VNEAAIALELRQIRQSQIVLLNLIGATLRGMAKEERPSMDQVQALLRRAASDLIDPTLQGEARKQAGAILG